MSSGPWIGEAAGAMTAPSLVEKGRKLMARPSPLSRAAHNTSLTIVSTAPDWKAMRAASLEASLTTSALNPCAASKPLRRIVSISQLTVPNGRTPIVTMRYSCPRAEGGRTSAKPPPNARNARRVRIEPPRALEQRAPTRFATPPRSRGLMSGEPHPSKRRRQPCGAENGVASRSPVRPERGFAPSRRSHQPFRFADRIRATAGVSLPVGGPGALERLVDLRQPVGLGRPRAPAGDLRGRRVPLGLGADILGRGRPVLGQRVHRNRRPGLRDFARSRRLARRGGDGGTGAWTPWRSRARRALVLDRAGFHRRPGACVAAAQRLLELRDLI